MPDNDLAAAVERLRRVQNGEGVPEYDAHQNLIGGVLCRDYLNDLMATSDAYLARESDDAKPVDREWLVSVLGEPSRNGVWYHALASDPQRKHEIEIMLRGDICGDLLCAESPQSATVRLPTRKKLWAFFELADWPTNENGGE